ncbi:MAG: alpha-amylase family glycosyl hydrolase [Fidelibacterota bacterium]
MKNKILFGILLLSVLPAFTQVVWTEPEYATEEDSITVFFDATQATRTDLVGYTGDLYTHTGVNTSAGNWIHVIGSWGNNSVQPKLTRISDNVYKLVIGFPREFYSVSDTTEMIYSLNFVFRSADATRQTEDIFYELYDYGITAVIDSPSVNANYGDVMRSPRFYEINDVIAFKIKAAALNTEVDSIRIVKNGSLVYLDEWRDSLLYTETALESGRYHYEVIVTDTTGFSDAAEFGAMVNPKTKNVSPPASIKPGINILNSQSAGLALFAPYKDFVYVIGDFNDWIVDTSYYMNRYFVSDDSILFWLEIDNLNPASEYAFQYLVDGNIRIADPYTEKILDPWNDHDIPSSIYPNLKAYPSGKTGEAVSLFQTGENEYSWTFTEWDKPAQEQLIIYELLIRDFLEQHDYQTLIDTLDYLANLGVNAIELMPVNEFEGNSSWGYNPSFYFALDKYYGPAIDFKYFVDECHGRGIAVIIDMVLNHSFGQSPLVRLYDHGSGTTAPENPWYNEEHNFTNPDARWGFDFDHESMATQYFVDRVTKYWVTEYGVDGYRFDFTKGIGNNIKTASDPWGSNYDADRIRLLKRIADALWEVDSSAYIILEHLAENSEEKVLADYGMLLWGNLNWSYSQASMGYSTDSDFSWGYFKNRSWTKPHLVTYMESHDEERLMYKNLTWGNSAGDYSIKELSTALKRQKLVNAFFLTLPGPKMIWQFGELGYDVSIDYDGRLSEKPIRWHYFQDVERKSLYKTIAALLKLRHENDVFTNPAASVQMSVGSNTKRIVMSGSPNVVIIGNFGVTSLSVTPNFQHTGRWYDYFSGDSINVVSGSDPIALEPGEFHIYTDSKLDTPEPGIINHIAETGANYPHQFVLYPNFPNPFNATTTLRYDVERQSDLRIGIYDLRGQEVYSNQLDNQPPGCYSFYWDGRNGQGEMLQSGIYFLVFQRGAERRTQKITLIK